jgi:hypothetical protein
VIADHVERPVAAGRTAAVVIAMCVGISVAAFAVPATLAYDAWSWLVWGREVVHLDLHTTDGPSWKPLPVLLATLVAPLGWAAPAVWLVVARTLGLLAVVGAYRVAQVLAGRSAGLLAAGLLLLTPDGGPRFLRLLLEGHSAPITAGLALWAVERQLAGRYEQAFVLLTLLALDRPESWPFVGIYGLWLWRRRPARRALVAGCFLAIVLLWFGGDQWGSGSPIHGAEVAQVSTGEAGRIGQAVDSAVNSVVLPVWVAAAVALVWSRRSIELLLVAAAGLWALVVIAMSAVLGYAAVARFYLPSAALVCVVAGAGVAHGVRRARQGWRRGLVVAAVVAVASPSVVGRASNVGALLDTVEARATADDDLDAALDLAGGAARLRPCVPIAIESTDVPRPALAWRVDVPLSDVGPSTRVGAGAVVVRTGGQADVGLRATGPPVVELARGRGWVVYAVNCASASRS